MVRLPAGNRPSIRLCARGWWISVLFSEQANPLCRRDRPRCNRRPSATRHQQMEPHPADVAGYSRLMGDGRRRSEPTVIDRMRPRKSGSQETLRWRERDSNPRSLVREASLLEAARFERWRDGACPMSLMPDRQQQCPRGRCRRKSRHRRYWPCRRRSARFP
jgi:hypothetical protein